MMLFNAYICTYIGVIYVYFLECISFVCACMLKTVPIPMVFCDFFILAREAQAFLRSVVHVKNVWSVLKKTHAMLAGVHSE
jgi:hypothetical protein